MHSFTVRFTLIQFVIMNFLDAVEITFSVHWGINVSVSSLTNFKTLVMVGIQYNP